MTSTGTARVLDLVSITPPVHPGPDAPGEEKDPASDESADVVGKRAVRDQFTRPPQRPSSPMPLGQVRPLLPAMDDPALQGPLLRLPAELRHQILQEAISTPRRPTPVSPAAAQDNRVRFYNRAGKIDDRKTSIYVEENDPARAVDDRASTALALRLTSRQLRDEADNVLSRIVPELDVMFVNHIGIMPTWLSRSPVCPRRIPTLPVRVRASYMTMDMPKDWILWTTPSTYPNDMDRTLENQVIFLSIYLLQSCAGLARPGPANYDPERADRWMSPRPWDQFDPADLDPAEFLGFGSDQDYLVPWPTIDVIVIDIEAPDMVYRNCEPTVSPVFGVEIFTGYDAWPATLKRPEGVEDPRAGPEHKLAASFAEVFKEILDESDSWEAYGMYLFTNVGKIDIRVDGETLAEIDVGWGPSRAARTR